MAFTISNRQSLYFSSGIELSSLQTKIKNIEVLSVSVRI